MNPDNDPRGAWTSGDLAARNYYAQGNYEVVAPSGRRFTNPIGSYWRVTQKKFSELDDGRIWWGRGQNNMPRLKRFRSDVKEGFVPETIWPYGEVGHTQEAKKELLAIVSFARSEDVLNTVKPTRLLRRIVTLGTDPRGSDTVLDFFAGSGTTGDAVIRQNRADGAHRRFILVELGRYFDDLVLQRISRSMYTGDWHDGQPGALPNEDEANRGPRIVKVLRIESYEDALHNLATDATVEAASPREAAHAERLGLDRYRLNYLVRLPLEADASLLDLGQLEHPFHYRLEVLNEEEPREQTVDLVETFNPVYGLHVRNIEALVNAEDGRYCVVRGDRGNARVLVVWRDITDLDPALERHFLESLAGAEVFDEKLINGDSAAPGFRSLDLLFKRLIDTEEQ